MAVTYKDGILYVDNSILSTYATCPLKAMISYGLDKRRSNEDNANLKVGSALHLALEHYLLGKSEEQCVAVLSNEYKDWANTHIYDNKRLAYANIESVFRSWITKYPFEKMPFSVKPEDIEIAFEVPLNDEGSILFTGRIDFIARARHGSALFAIDHKTTGQIDSKKKREYTMSSQMSGYLWALGKLGHDISGIYINAVHTGLVPSSNRKCQTHKAHYEECGFLHLNHELLGPYQRSPQELADWHADALALATEWKQALDYVDGDKDKLRHIQARGKWIYGACGMCSWEDYCRTGQNSFWIDNNTVTEPWYPGTVGKLYNL